MYWRTRIVHVYVSDLRGAKTRLVSVGQGVWVREGGGEMAEPGRRASRIPRTRRARCTSRGPVEAKV